MEALTPNERDSFTVELFGSPADLTRLLAARLTEQAVHSWDVAVSLDPGATLAPDSVALLIDDLPQTVAWVRPVPGFAPNSLVTTDPERSFLLTLDPAARLEAGGVDDNTLRLPAEALPGSSSAGSIPIMRRPCPMTIELTACGKRALVSEDPGAPRCPSVNPDAADGTKVWT